MKIGLDIDGTISERPLFFSMLSSGFRANGHEIVILTYRDQASINETKLQLTRWRIWYDHLQVCDSLEDKALQCEKLGIDVFFDDQDECLVGISEKVLVCKVRNGGNFDFERRHWISTPKLTRHIT